MKNGRGLAGTGAGINENVGWSEGECFKDFLLRFRRCGKVGV